MYRRIWHLDAELLGFGNAVVPLGSSVGLIHSTRQLRLRLRQVLHLFHEVAISMFHEKIVHDSEQIDASPSSRETLPRYATVLNYHHSLELPLHLGNSSFTSDVERLPDQFRFLARDLVSFLHCLNDIPEFVLPCYQPLQDMPMTRPSGLQMKC